MKICVYNVTSTIDLPGTSEVGGTEEFSFKIAEAWQRSGHQVVIVGGAPRGQGATRPTSVPLKLFPYVATSGIPDFGSRFRKLMQRVLFAKEALEYVQAEGFDLVLALKPYDLLSFFFSNLKKSCCVLFRFGGTDFFPTDKWWKNAAHLFFANSPMTAAKVSKRYGCECKVVSNGAVLPEHPAVIDEKTRTIFSVGRLVGWKGFSNLIEALSPLRNRKDLRLVIAGDGEEKPKLEALIKELDLKDKVKLPGRLPEEEIKKMMRQGALYLQPSIGYDSCPNAVIEAMAAGLPVVISSQVGRLEGFEEGKHGLVFEAGDHQALFEIINRFLTHPEDHAKMGQEARRLVLEKHTLDKAAKQILDFARPYLKSGRDR